MGGGKGRREVEKQDIKWNKTITTQKFFKNNIS